MAFRNKKWSRQCKEIFADANTVFDRFFIMIFLEIVYCTNWILCIVLNKKVKESQGLPRSLCKNRQHSTLPKAEVIKVSIHANLH